MSEDFYSDAHDDNALEADTVREILAFRDDRAWRAFHNLKDLALSLTLESAELLECFQWTAEQTDRPSEREHMAEELADVLIYAVLFADRAGFNLNEIVRDKLKKNLRKYPRPASLGNAREAAPHTTQASDASAVATVAQRPVRRIPRSLLAVYLSHVRAQPIGVWSADAEGRVTYVRYSAETLAFWRALEGIDCAADETPERVNVLFSELIEALDIATLEQRLARLLRLERMRDGLFLEAQSRGVLERWLSALLATEP